MPAISKSQQKLFGMVYAYKNNKLDTSDMNKELLDKIKKIAKSISDEDAKDFASTKHDNIPDRVNEKFQPIKLKKILDSMTPSNKGIYQAFINTSKYIRLLTEISTSRIDGQDVDDGPGSFYRNIKTYKRQINDIATKIGYKIVSYLIDDDSVVSFKKRPYLPVTQFPCGVVSDKVKGVIDSGYEALFKNPNTKKWLRDIQVAVNLIGYEFLEFKDLIDKSVFTERNPKKK